MLPQKIRSEVIRKPLIDFNGQLVFGRNYPQFRNKMWIIFKFCTQEGNMPAKVNFIIGRAGTGKTHSIYSHIARNEKAAKRSVLIVPDSNVRNRTFAFRIHRRRHSLHIRSVVHNACTPCTDRNWKPKNLSVLAGTANARSPHC